MVPARNKAYMINFFAPPVRKIIHHRFYHDIRCSDFIAECALIYFQLFSQNSRSSRPEVFCEKSYLEKFRKIHRKISVSKSVS